MAQYLKLFKTEADYEAVVGTENEPEVAHIVEDVVVKEKKELFVDLGLPSGTLWATMNVGANSVTDYGNYYQYGKGADDYSITSGSSVYEGMERPLALSADTAAQVWGGEWHIPTSAQCAELSANTTYEWVTINDVKCGKFTAQNGNYILLPAGGSYYDGGRTLPGSYSDYLTSTYNYSSNIYCLEISKNFPYISGYSSRSGGYSVRPVIG